MTPEPQEKPQAAKGDEITRMTLEQLQTRLEEAIRIEDYGKAARLRDEIQRRKK